MLVPVTSIPRSALLPVPCKAWLPSVSSHSVTSPYLSTGTTVIFLIC